LNLCNFLLEVQFVLSQNTLCIITAYVLAIITYIDNKLQSSFRHNFIISRAFCGTATQRGSWPPHSWGF